MGGTENSSQSEIPAGRPRKCLGQYANHLELPPDIVPAHPHKEQRLLVVSVRRSLKQSLGAGPARALRPVHLTIGAFQQLLHAFAWFGFGYANGCPNVKPGLPAAPCNRVASAYPLAHASHLAFSFRQSAIQHHDEFVAAPPPNQVRS